ncbi:MAG: hypothetical protein AB1938_25945 [Myxococcota bacterium]
MRTTLLTLGVLLGSACCDGPEGWGPPEPPSPLEPSAPCGCTPGAVVPATGEVTLRPHVDEDTYLRSVVSFQYAVGGEGVDITNNDWDVSLAGNDVFRVNTVTDDSSCIQDLGAIAIADAPEQLTECHDFLQVVEGHVYLVRTEDEDTRQHAVFGVIHHAAGRETTLRWFRSPDPDAFILEF